MLKRLRVLGDAYHAEVKVLAQFLRQKNPGMQLHPELSVPDRPPEIV